MSHKNSGLAYIGVVLLSAVLILAVFAGFSTAFGAASSTVSTTVTVGNATPTVTSVSLNNGSAIVLTPNATTSFNINYTVSDNNGCADINTNNMTSTAFRNGDSSNCAKPSPTTSNTSCYLFISSTRTTSTCQASVTINVTDTVQIYYFADSTGNNSSTFSTDHWEAYATAHDASDASSSATSTSVDINVLTAVNVTTSSINYSSAGNLSASSTSPQQNATTTNAGNSTTSLQLYALQTLATGTISIATGSQHYATTTGQSFDAGSVALTDTPVTATGFKLLTPTATNSVGTSTYWFLNVPAGTNQDTYTGTNVFSPKWSQ